MPELIICPNCFVKYRLRPERVHSGIRRVRCFRCENVFSVAEVISKLFSDISEPVPAILPPDSDHFLDVDSRVAAPPTEESPIPAAEELPPRMPLEGGTTFYIDEAATTESVVEDFISTGIENDTETITETPPFAEVVEAGQITDIGGDAEPEPAPQEPIGDAAFDGTIQATDIIEATPETPHPVEVAKAEQVADIGGDAVPELTPQEFADAPVSEPVEAVSAPEMSKNVALAGGTVHLSPQDILAAMASSMAMATPQIPVPQPPEQENKTEPEASVVEAPTEEKLPISSEEPAVSEQPTTDVTTNTEESTLSEDASNEQFPAATPQNGQKESTVSAQTDQQTTNEASRFKVRMGDVLLEHLAIEEVATMVTEGKLLESHLVARQFNENWIEASKVPALMPVFSRLRQSQPQAFPSPPPPIMDSPKRGLFQGLFGRN